MQGRVCVWVGGGGGWAKRDPEIQEREMEARSYKNISA